jgi:hypothetical protein
MDFEKPIEIEEYNKILEAELKDEAKNRIIQSDSDI